MIVDAVADRIISSKMPNMGPMKLQKLLYYAQGWNLAVRQETLFPDDIEAWRYGPVVPPIYRRFKRYGSDIIPRNAIITVPENVLAKASLKLIDDVIAKYGDMSAGDLMRQTHDEPPWSETWGSGSPGESGNAVIEIDLIYRYFRKQIDRLRVVTPSNEEWREFVNCARRVA